MEKLSRQAKDKETRKLIAEQIKIREKAIAELEREMYPEEKDFEAYFDTDAPSVLVDILEEALEQRRKTKQKIQEAKTQDERNVYTKQDQAFKVIVNSAYGVMGTPKFRLYRPGLAEACTVASREIINYTAQKAREWGYQPFYGDTDSIFIALGKDFKGDPVEAGKELADRISESLKKDAPTLFALNDNTPARFKKFSIEMDMETVYESMALWRKKNYVGKVLWTKGQYVTKYIWKNIGVRSDVSTLIREIRTTLARSLIDGGTPEQRRAYLNQIKKKLVDRECSLLEIGSPKQLNKNISDYKAPQTHVRGADYSNTYLGTSYKRGDKPMWAYVVSPPGYPSTDVISYTADTVIPNGFDPDYKLLIEKQIQPTIDWFLDIVDERYNIPADALKPGVKTLETFWGNK